MTPEEVYSHLTGETGAIQVIIEHDDILVHIDIISGPGRGQRANCIRHNFQHRCETQMRPIDAPPGPMNNDSRIVLREDEAGASILVMWADLDEDGHIDPGEVADVDQINWTDPWTHITFGDSYTAGTGIQAGYIADTSTSGDACLRSQLAYGWQIEQIAIEGTVLASTTSSSPGLVDFRYAPCSGAIVGSIAGSGHRGAPVQAREASVAPHIDPTVDLITLTAGGNDVRFAPILTHCIGNVRDQLQIELVSQICQDHPLIEGDPQILRIMMDEMIDDLGDELTRLYQTLRVQAPNALIVQAGYPLVIDPEATDCYGLP